jgi:hypothetical protein
VQLYHWISQSTTNSGSSERRAEGSEQEVLRLRSTNPTCQLNSTWCAAWADYDGDGYVDVITLGHVQNLTNSIPQLWHNNGDGTFSNVAAEDGLELHDNVSAHKEASWADYDNDGFPDLMIKNGVGTEGVMALIRALTGFITILISATRTIGSKSIWWAGKAICTASERG